MNILAIVIVAFTAFFLGFIVASVLQMGGRCSAEEELEQIRRARGTK